ncbi:MAG: CinA family protein [Sphaerochaetaceae bacterium]|nr:CinA family protein [Sphaerochaetaceae bacterium]
MVNEKKVREEYEFLTKSLISKKLTITTMESCTAGQIASLITDTEGSSEILKGAFVTYSNEVKVMMGVPKEIIDRYTVYSEETALEMAKACKKKLGADIGVGVTGTMGNVDPENREASEPGKVYFAIVFKNDCYTYSLTLPCQETRLMYKLLVADKIYEKLSLLIWKKYVQPSDWTHIS